MRYQRLWLEFYAPMVGVLSACGMIGVLQEMLVMQVAALDGRLVIPDGFWVHAGLFGSAVVAFVMSKYGSEDGEDADPS